MLNRYRGELRSNVRLVAFRNLMRKRWAEAGVSVDEPEFESLNGQNFEISLLPAAADVLRDAPEILRFRCLTVAVQ